MALRVLAYLRVSGQEQGRTGTSLEGQRDEIARYCASARLPPPSYFLEIESGSAERTEQRTEQLRLQSEARPGDVVLVCAVDRWSRDIVHAVSSVRALVARGVRWLAIREGLDASTSHGDSVLGIMSWTADQERRRIRERTVGRRAQLKAAGIYVEGAVPLGYRRHAGDRRGRGIEIDPEGAGVVRRLFALCIEGHSLERIAAALPQGSRGRGTWEKQGVLRHLRNRVYLGEIEARPGVWILGRHPAIIDRDTWERARAALDARRLGGRNASDTSRTASWILRTRARCALCGAKMGSVYSRPTSMGGAEYYACTARLRPGKRARCKASYVRVDESERAAAEQVLARLAELRGELARAHHDDTATATPRTDHGAALASLARRRTRVLDLAERGHLEGAELETRLARLEAERGRIEIARAAEERAAEHARAAADPSRRRELLSTVRGLRAAWERMAPAERRRVVELLCERAELRAGEAPAMRWRTVEALLTRR